MEFNINKIDENNRSLANSFIIENWFSTDMSVRGKVVDATKLDGFILIENEKVIGLVTYLFWDKICEIITLDSKRENIGIGSALIQNVEKVAKERNVQKIQLITTNDNLRALQFYQKRDYYITNIYVNAMDEVRKIKNVPLIGENGIPLRDEIELAKKL